MTQGCIYLIDEISNAMMSKDENMTDLEFFNYNKGIRFQKLAILHGYKYIYESMMEKVMAEKNEKCR